MTPRAFSAKLFPSWAAPQYVLVHGVVSPQVQNFALPFVDLHEVPISPFLQPLQVLLDGSATPWHISYSLQFCVNGKLAEGTPYPIIHMNTLKHKILFHKL